MNDSIVTEANVPEIPKAKKPRKPRGPNKPKGDKLFPVVLVKNYMPLDMSGRIMAGAEVSLPLDEAKGLIAKGIARRNDPIG